MKEITKGNKCIGMRIYKRNNNSENQVQYKNNYTKVYHGTQYPSIESILRFGLKKIKKPRKYHIPLHLTINSIDNWADAIFVSPSIFYASLFSDILCSKGDFFLILFEGKVKNSSFTSHPSTIVDYKLKNGEPKEIEFRIEEEENIFIESLLFLSCFFLYDIENYEEGNI